MFEKNSQAFSLPFPHLSGLERLQFQAGDALFTESWVAAPASTKGRDGLGPLLITRACANCQLRDGRGDAPLDANEEPTGLLVRLSSQEAHAYGDQIQNRSIPGAQPEASVKIDWIETEFQLDDGTRLPLRKPRLRLENLAYGHLPADVLTSLRLAPPVHGLGLLEAVSADTILKYQDAEDQDKDGVSGRANEVFSQVTGRMELGRFGWKANQPSLIEQDAAALNGDMGLTTRLFSAENCTAAQVICAELPHGGQPEVEDKQLNLLLHYSRFLAVPGRRNSKDPDVQAGRAVVGPAVWRKPSSGMVARRKRVAGTTAVCLWPNARSFCVFCSPYECP